MTILDGLKQSTREEEQILRTFVEREFCEYQIDIGAQLDDDLASPLDREKCLLTANARNRRLSRVDCCQESLEFWPALRLRDAANSLQIAFNTTVAVVLVAVVMIDGPVWNCWAPFI